MPTVTNVETCYRLASCSSVSFARVEYFEQCLSLDRLGHVRIATGFENFLAVLL